MFQVSLVTVLAPPTEGLIGIDVVHGRSSSEVPVASQNHSVSAAPPGWSPGFL
jgi:hypothetical protein